jgi:hypothetical protein
VTYCNRYLEAITASPHGRRFLDLAGWPLWPNPWPDGVGVEWVKGEGWVPHFDVDARELLSDYHRGRTSARALTAAEFGADLARNGGAF